MKRYVKVNGRLTDEDIEDCIQAVIATNRLEGLVSPPEEIDMVRRYMRGDITESEYMAWVYENAGVKP